MWYELDGLPPWEVLLKRVLWMQIGQLSGKRILRGRKRWWRQSFGFPSCSPIGILHSFTI